MADTIRVEVAYADLQRQILCAIDVAAGSTVEAAIAASGILAQLPGLVPAGYGVFGRVAELATPLRDGDRVEIYRPLQVDPKQARRNRASA